MGVGARPPTVSRNASWTVDLRVDRGTPLAVHDRVAQGRKESAMSFEHLSSERDCPFVSLVTCFALAAATLVTGCAKHETSSEAEAPMGLTSSQESIAVRAPQSQTAQTPQSTTTTSSATLEVGPDLTKACDLK